MLHCCKVQNNNNNNNNNKQHLDKKYISNKKNKSGIVMLDMKNSQISNATAAYNNNAIFSKTNNTNFSSISVMNIHQNGIALFTDNNNNNTEITASHNGGNGISISLSENINIY